MVRLTVILDACVLINLLASDEFDGLIALKALEFAICSKVQDEAIYLRPTDESATAPEQIVVHEIVKKHGLTLLDIEGAREEVLFVNYAAQLDDGEAMSLALAESRGFILATDDRKARRLFESRIGRSDRLTSTPELLRAWAESERVAAARLRSVLRNVMRRAKFFPGPNDPDFSWWDHSAR